MRALHDKKVGQRVRFGMALLLVMAIAPPVAARRELRGYTMIGVGVADDPQALTGEKVRGRGDGFLTLRPGGMYLDRTQLREHKITYLLGLTQNPASSAGNSVTQNLGISSKLAYWERLTLEFEASGSHGLVNQTAPLVDAEEELLGVAPQGQIYYLGAWLGESASYTLTPDLTVYQALSGGVFAPFRGREVDRSNLIVEHALGISREFREHSVRGEFTVGHERQTRSRFDPDLFPAGQAEYGNAMAGWSHDPGPSWGFDLGAGAYAARESNHPDTAVGPAGRVGLRLNGRVFRGGVNYEHRAWPSVILGGILIGDRAVARVGGSFGNNEMFHLRLSTMVQRVRTLDAPDLSPVGMFLGRVNLGVRPYASQHIEIGLFYRLRAQEGGELGNRVLGTYARHVIMFSVSAGFPLSGVEEERIGK